MKLIIKASGGFGNKIFNIIIGLYIAHINNYDNLYTYIRQSYHDKDTDPSIFDIFPKLNDFFKIITNEEMDKLYDYKNHQFKCSDVKTIKDFNINTNAEVIFISSRISKCYKFIYEIFNGLPNNMKQIFVVNDKLIDKNIIDITKQNKYAVIHIRYGDKLNIALEKGNQYRFLIYTPQFYRKIIRKLLKKNYKIYIVSDDNKIIKKYILNKFNDNQNISILNISWWNSFYLLSHSKYNILSMSTFSFLATMINNNVKKATLIKRSDDIAKWSIPEEYIINKTNWKIIDNKKYILNFNQRLIKKMLNFR